MLFFVRVALILMPLHSNRTVTKTLVFSKNKVKQLYEIVKICKNMVFHAFSRFANNFILINLSIAKEAS